MSPGQTLVVGGGAAGLMAAGQAALTGAKVCVLEKMGQPGRKIGISGKGRCNLTNTADLPDFIQHFGPNGKFLHQCFNQFFTPQLIEFFHANGLPLVTERGGRVFPASGKALDVVKTLKRWLTELQVPIHLNNQVERLLIADNCIAGVYCNGRKLTADNVILTTGGASYPRTGSSGDGYHLAKEAGHSLVPIRPALVPLETAGDTAQTLNGLELRNISVKVLIDNKRSAQTFGELCFTEHGVSGPVILTLSGAIVDQLHRQKRVTLSIDTKPALDENKLDRRLLRDFETRSKEPIASVIRGLLPRQMVPLCLQQCQLAGDKPAGQISAKERRRLRGWLKDFRLEVSGYRPFDEAIITAGGVDVREIDPRTMESRLVRGLFIAGELLDLQADTGGFNLQAAFSTGWLAGRSIR